MNDQNTYTVIIDQTLNLLRRLPKGDLINRPLIKKYMFANISRYGVSKSNWFSLTEGKNYNPHQRGPHAVDWAFNTASKLGYIKKVNHGLWEVV